MEDTPEKAFLRQEVRRYASIHVASKKKIKHLQQSQRRLKRKVASFKNVIGELSKNRILVDENVQTLKSLVAAEKTS